MARPVVVGPYRSYLEKLRYGSGLASGGHEQGERRVTTIAITGVGGLLGRRVAAALDARDDVDRIVGTDVRVPEGLSARKLAVRSDDVRDPGIEDAFRDADVVVHLAFQLDPLHDEAEMHAVNVEGTRNVFEAAARAGVGHLVYLSSVVVYGAEPDNDFPLTEDSRLRPVPDLNYAEHKHEIETWLGPWIEEHPDLHVAVLRAAVVLGPGVDNFITRIFEAPRITVVKGHKPPLQFVHVDDAVSAIVHAVEHRLSGPYNVAAEGWLSFDEVTAVVGRRTIAVPEEVAFSSTERLWKLGVGEQPPGIVRLFMHPWVVSPDKLIATGWHPQHSNRDALAATVEDHEGYLSFVGIRTTRRTIRRGALAVAGVCAVFLVRWLRRRD